MTSLQTFSWQIPLLINHFREYSEEIIFVESTFLLKSGILGCKFVMLEKKGQFCNGF